MSDEPIDFAAEGLLDGLEGEREPSAWRCSRNWPPKACRSRSCAARPRRHDHVPARRPRDRQPQRYTAAAVAELTGLDQEFLTRLRRAMGLPIPEADEAVYTRRRARVARGMIHVARAAGISDEELLDLLRVLGRGLVPGRRSRCVRCR